MTETAGPVEPTKVDKPWGEELWFAAVDHAYAGKLITIHAGASVSLQRHHQKTETIMVLDGTGRVELGQFPDQLEPVELRPGTCVHIPAPWLHRFTADTELRFIEVSTAHEGWTTDVERLEDHYGRGGTSAP